MVDISGEALVADRKTHKKKMDLLKERMTQAKKEQNELKANLGKFNTFVREKQSKAGRGLETERDAKRATNRMTEDIKTKDTLVDTLDKTKVICTFVRGGNINTLNVIIFLLSLITQN
jgi:hypothetical protein